MPLGGSSNPVIVAELVMPGFTADLSTWVCSIDGEGALRQDVNLATSRNRYRRERKTFTAQVEPTAVSEILDAARAGGFDRLTERYSADGWTDLPTMALAFRIGSELMRVEAYGPGALAYEGSDDMKLFVELWRRVERHLPYGGA